MRTVASEAPLEPPMSYPTKYGMLHCGFEGGYGEAEKFVSYILFRDYFKHHPDFCLKIAVRTGNDVCDYSNFNLKHIDAWPKSWYDAYEAVLTQFLVNNWYDAFGKFLDACAETGAFDEYFQSKRFFEELYVGNLKGFWNIQIYGTSGKLQTLEEQRQRLIALVKFCRKRYPNWEEEYRKGDDFFGHYDWKHFDKRIEP